MSLIKKALQHHKLYFWFQVEVLDLTYPHTHDKCWFRKGVSLLQALDPALGQWGQAEKRTGYERGYERGLGKKRRGSTLPPFLFSLPPLVPHPLAPLFRSSQLTESLEQVRRGLEFSTCLPSLLSKYHVRKIENFIYLTFIWILKTVLVRCVFDPLACVTSVPEQRFVFGFCPRRPRLDFRRSLESSPR